MKFYLHKVPIVILYFVLLGMHLNTYGQKELYVAPTGGDDAYTREQNDIDHPWATPNRAWYQSQPGDVVYFRGGTYTLTELIITKFNGSNGTATQPITFKSYTGELATIDCINLPTAFSIQKEYNLVENMNFINYRTCFYVGQDLSGQHFTARNCEGTANRGGDNVGFIVLQSTNANYTVIENNRIIGPGVDASLHGNTTCLYFTRTSRVKILHNELSNAPIGIYSKHSNALDAQNTDIEIAYNYIVNMRNNAMQLVCNYAYVHDNLMGVNGDAITLGVDGGMGDGYVGADFNYIENNTIFATPLLVEGSPSIGMTCADRGYDAQGQLIDLYRGCTNNTIRNNIFMARLGAHLYGPPKDVNSNPIAGYNYNNTYDYNMYHNRSYVSGVGHPNNYALAAENQVMYNTIEEWRAHNGTDANSISATPVFVGGEAPTSIAGFELAAGSPGKNIGSDGKDLGADISKVGIQTVGNQYDVTPPSIPTNLTATATSSTQINLNWIASTDNVGVAGYRVYRNETFIATTSQTSYIDAGLTTATQYNYTVASYDDASNLSAQSNSVSILLTSTGDEIDAVNGYYLGQNYPNPFNQSTRIDFKIPITEPVSIRVYDTLGNEVAVLVNEQLSAGAHSVWFDSNKLSSGFYFYTLKTKNFSQSKKMFLTK